jgi:hypothetical protein
MAEPATSIGVVEKLLSTLRTIPTWLFIGVALTAACILFCPDFVPVKFSTFRTQWGSYVAIVGVLALFLAVARVGEAVFHAALTARKNAQSAQILKFWDGPAPTRLWAASKQTDGRHAIQILFSLTVLNTTPAAARLARVELIKPTFPEVVDATLFIASHEPVHYSDLAPHESATVEVRFLVYGKPPKAEKPVSATIAIFDHRGTRYLVKKVVCKPMPTPKT